MKYQRDMLPSKSADQKPRRMSNVGGQNVLEPATRLTELMQPNRFGQLLYLSFHLSSLAQSTPIKKRRFGPTFSSWLVVCVAGSNGLIWPCDYAHAQSAPHQLTGLNMVREKYGLQGHGQTVAIIDTGIAYDHSALGGGFGAGFRVVGGWDFAEAIGSDPYDDPSAGSHGTHVAGIVGAADGDPATGVAPAADLVGLRVFNDAGSGSFDWIEDALEWVHQNRNEFEHPITTVNISLGASWNSHVPPTWATLEQKLAQLEADGLFISVAAGNEFANYATPGLSYPAASPHVVPVMCIDDSGQLSYFSQRHSRAIAAPGRLISSTVPDYAGDGDGMPDDYATRSGTNMAAPYVSGASVLIREVMEFVGYIDITQQTIYEHMLTTADSILDPISQQSYSRLNLLAAIDALIPEDDYGSTADTANDLGAIGASAQIAGLIGTIDDADYFVFTAASNATASLITTSSTSLEPNWVVLDEERNVILGDGESSFSFPVTAGKHYSIGLSSGSGIGNFQTTISLEQSNRGDYDGDGVVAAADYTVWRDTLGSTIDLQADGSLNGIVDKVDYDIWKSNFSPRPGGHSTVPGDFNDDGMVSAADYTVWRDTLGSINDLRADGSLNGIIDMADYAVWKQSFTEMRSPSAVIQVPEPSSRHVLMTIVVLLSLLRTRVPGTFQLISVETRSCA
jgi:Subtilase family